MSPSALGTAIPGRGIHAGFARHTAIVASFTLVRRSAAPRGVVRREAPLRRHCPFRSRLPGTPGTLDRNGQSRRRGGAEGTQGDAERTVAGTKKPPPVRAGAGVPRGQL